MAFTNISNFLGPSSNSMVECPPPDVKFLFQEETGVKEIEAHKQILAFSSNVFNREFFGSMKSENEIMIKDASHEVFQVMIECIYNKQPNWFDYDLEFLSSLYNLAEKYNIAKLKDVIIAEVPKHKVTMENVLEVAILAEKNTLHQPWSSALYNAAAKFFMKKDQGERFDSTLELFSPENTKHSLVIFKVMERIKELKSEKCGNCNQNPCVTGQILSTENFVAGAQVIARPSSQHTGLGKLIRFNQFDPSLIFCCFLNCNKILSAKLEDFLYNC